MDAEKPKPKTFPEGATYPSSWFDKFSAWVRQLPGPSWAAYFLMVMLMAGVGILIQRMENPSQPIGFEPIAILTFFQTVYVLSLMDFLDKRAERAMETFRPVLKIGENLYDDLKARLTTLPARSTLILTVFVLLFFAIMSSQMISSSAEQGLNLEISAAAAIFTYTPSGIFSFVTFVLLWVVNSLFIYHTFHQLNMINFIYTQCSEINIFSQNELYAFSNVSAATGIGLVLSTPVWLIVDPGPISLGINIAFAILAVIIFITPLLGVHNLLKTQKVEFIKNSLGKKESLIKELFARIENKDLSDIENYDRALSSLEKAHNEIESISTWPWKTETLRQVIGALFVPVTIWMIQFYLNQLLTN